jgi:hypothetical protein
MQEYRRCILEIGAQKCLSQRLGYTLFIVVGVRCKKTKVALTLICGSALLYIRQMPI